jgi:hypothetical protein
MPKICPKMSYRSDVDIDEGKVVFCVEQECAMYYVGSVGAAGMHAMECTYLVQTMVFQELALELDDIRKSAEAINDMMAVGVPVELDDLKALNASLQAIGEELTENNRR